MGPETFGKETGSSPEILELKIPELENQIKTKRKEITALAEENYSDEELLKKMRESFKIKAGKRFKSGETEIESLQIEHIQIQQAKIFRHKNDYLVLLSELLVFLRQLQKSKPDGKRQKEIQNITFRIQAEITQLNQTIQETRQRVADGVEIMSQGFERQSTPETNRQEKPANDRMTMLKLLEKSLNNN